MKNIGVSTTRLEDFLLTAEHEKRQTIRSEPVVQRAGGTEQTAVASANSDACVAVLSGATLGWSTEEERATDNSSGDIVLTGVNLRVNTGSVTGVLGKVGSGKSTLLSAVIGEQTPIVGSSASTPGPIGYVPQRPFIIGI